MQQANTVQRRPQGAHSGCSLLVAESCDSSGQRTCSRRCTRRDGPKEDREDLGTREGLLWLEGLSTAHPAVLSAAASNLLRPSSSTPLVSATIVVLGFWVSNLMWWHEAWRIGRRPDIGVFRPRLAYAVQLREAFTSRRVGHRTVLRHNGTEAVCAHV